MPDSVTTVQLLTSLGLIVGYLVVAQLVQRLLGALGRRKGVPGKRTYYVQAYFRLLLLFVLAVAVALVWSVDFRGLLVFASSIFAVVGVALFAQWSILSNLTASMVIFFAFPHRIGDFIRILDGDNSVTGQIAELTLFQVLIRNPEGDLVSYPNNLLLQRPVVKLAARPPSVAPDTVDLSL